MSTLQQTFDMDSLLHVYHTSSLQEKRTYCFMTTITSFCAVMMVGTLCLTFISALATRRALRLGQTLCHEPQHARLKLSNPGMKTKHHVCYSHHILCSQQPNTAYGLLITTSTKTPRITGWASVSHTDTLHQCTLHCKILSTPQQKIRTLSLWIQDFKLYTVKLWFINVILLMCLCSRLVFTSSTTTNTLYQLFIPFDLYYFYTFITCIY